MKKFKFNLLGVLVLFVTASTFIACNNDDLGAKEKMQFDYSLYESAKNSGVFTPTLPENMSQRISVESSEYIIESINTYYDTNLVLDSELLNINELKSDDYKQKFVDLGVITSSDVELLNLLEADLIEHNDLDLALENLEINVLNSGKNVLMYSEFSNYLKLAENKEPIFFDSSKRAMGSWGCFGAIVAHTLVSVAVGVSCVPNPATPIACPLAVTSWIVSYANMLNACSDNPK